MKTIKIILGRVLHAIATGISVIIDSLIWIIETLVLFVGSFLKGCIALISMGGCLFFLLFANLGFGLLMNPVALFTILFLLTFSIFGGKFVFYLKYQKYILTEFLLNTANCLTDGEKYKFKAFGEYKAAYKRAEEARQREEQRRYYEQQKEWEERFRQQWQYQQRGQGSYDGYGSQGSHGFGYTDPAVEFKHIYERSCNVMGISYDAAPNEIKTAYRRKAKEFHPDLNKHPDATKRFQEISAAYKFLNEENINRYKNMK